jgi:hypothetical protein
MSMAADWVAVAVFLLGASVALASAPLALAEAAQDAARARLQRAFDRTFQPPGVRRIALRVSRGGREVTRRAFELAHRREGGGARSLVRFVEPDYLRGHALLIVSPGAGEPPDIWLYQPEERRPRRVGMAQKREAFYGSDLSYEDLERADWRRWRVSTLGADVEGGAPCTVLDAWPPADSQYGRLRVWLSEPLAAVARIDFFARAGAAPDAGEAPVKRLRVALAGVEEEQGYLRVRRIEIEAVGRDARTELVVERMAVDPEISASVFSAVRLEREGERLFELSERQGRETPP